jgi:hypothetical protein
LAHWFRSRLRETTFNRVCSILNRGKIQRVEIVGRDLERETAERQRGNRRHRRSDRGKETAGKRQMEGIEEQR